MFNKTQKTTEKHKKELELQQTKQFEERMSKVYEASLPLRRLAGQMLSQIPDVAYNNITRKALTHWQPPSPPSTITKFGNECRRIAECQDIVKIIDSLDDLTKIYNQLSPDDFKQEQWLALLENQNKFNELATELFIYSEALDDADKSTGKIKGFTEFVKRLAAAVASLCVVTLVCVCQVIGAIACLTLIPLLPLSLLVEKAVKPLGDKVAKRAEMMTIWPSFLVWAGSFYQADRNFRKAESLFTYARTGVWVSPSAFNMKSFASEEWLERIQQNGPFNTKP